MITLSKKSLLSTSKLILTVLVALALIDKASAQNFIKAYNGSKVACGVSGFKEDTINNRLYMHHTILNTACVINYNYIACNQNGNWTFLGPFDNVIFSIEIFNNELYACGWFNNVNGQPISNLAKYNGSTWVAVPNFLSAVNPGRLKVINNELYLCGGTISTSNGDFNGAAKFNGSTWSGFNIPYLGDLGAYVMDIALFKNELLIGGNFTLSDGTQDLAYLHNGNWVKPGIGISGSMDEVTKLQEYKNILYIGGLIYKNEGNVGNMLIAWNGSNLISVGDGLKDDLNSYGSAQVNDMMVFKSKLYIAGKFNYAGDIFSCGLTVFDGNTFCSFDKTPVVSVGLDAIGHYKDTLWISGSQKYLNDSIKGIGKYVGNYSADTCSRYYDVGIKSYNNDFENEVTIYPNPCVDILNISTGTIDIENSIIEVTNYLGQKVISMPFQKNVDVSVLPIGFFMIKISMKNGKQINVKFVKSNTVN